MYYYNLALLQGGLMEDPDWHPEFIKTIHADNLQEAKQKWAVRTHHTGKDWNPESQTYWGWQVICLGSDDPDTPIYKNL